MNVRSVERAVDLIEVLVQSNRPLSLNTLSQAVNAPKSTTLNILRTLAARNVFEVDPATKCYKPGPMLMYLASRENTHYELQIRARPHLEELAMRAQESVFLSVLDGYEITYIDKIESPQPIRYIARIGTRRPLHCTSVGKLSMVMLGEEFLERYLKEHELSRHTPKTITDTRKLRRELERIRRRGYSVSAGEFIPDLMGIAVPIVNEAGRYVAAVNVAGPMFRMESRQAEIAQMAKDAVRAMLRSPVGGSTHEDAAA